MKEQPECKIDQHRAKRWYLNDKLHREDGPAYEDADGTKEWWLNGKWHREDGPAVERVGGSKYWFLHGEGIHPETLVDLHLSRGVFCYYNEETDTLHFDENNERTAQACSK